MSILFKAFLVGTGALLLSVVMITTTVTLTGDTFQPTMFINSVLGSYLIGSPVSYYLMKQSERISIALAEAERLHDELEAAHAKLQHRARMDVMTGMLNRDAFFKAVDEAKENSPDETSSILIADIDHFKQINDNWGHLEGDKAIIKVANAIKEVVGEEGLVGRIGGEEFAVFLNGKSQSEASELADHIVERTRELVFYPAETFRQPLSLSIGGAMAKNDGVTTDLIRRADRTLYRAKDTGRNRVVFEMPTAA